MNLLRLLTFPLIFATQSLRSYAMPDIAGKGVVVANTPTRPTPLAGLHVPFNNASMYLVDTSETPLVDREANQKAIITLTIEIDRINKREGIGARLIKCYQERSAAYKNDGNYRDATTDLENAIALHERVHHRSNPLLYQQIAELYENGQNPQKAMESYIKFCELENARGVIKKTKAARGKIIELRKELSLPEDAESYYRYGLTLGISSLAVENIEKAMTMTSANPKPHYLYAYANALGRNHDRDKNGRGANALLQAIQLDDNNPLYHAELGIRYRRLGKLELAVGSFSKAIEKSGENKNPIYFRQRGECFLEIGKYKEAYDDFSESIRLIEQKRTLKGQHLGSRYYDYFKRAEAFAKGGNNTDLIISDCQKAILEGKKQYPKAFTLDANVLVHEGILTDTFKIYMLLGKALLANKDYELAVTTFDMVIKEVLKFKPQVEELRLGLIHSYVALDYEMEKSLPVLYSERSRAYEGKGDIPTAIKDCLSMIEVSERHSGIRDPQQYIRIAALYQKSGQKEEQKTNIFQAIDLYEKQISSYDPTKNDPEADIIKKKTIAIYNDAISLLEKENSYGAKEKLKVFYLRRTELYGQFGDHQAVIDSAKEGIRSDSTDKSSCIELDAIRRKNHYLRGNYVKALLGASPCKEKATAERSSAAR